MKLERQSPRVHNQQRYTAITISLATHIWLHVHYPLERNHSALCRVSLGWVRFVGCHELSWAAAGNSGRYILPPVSDEWTEQGGSSYEHSSLRANQNPILWLYSVLSFVHHFLQSLSCSLVTDKRQYILSAILHVCDMLLLRSMASMWAGSEG
jgi:hypothetical protein